MRILVACEYSGIVRDAFLKNGHDAISCDLLPTDSPGPHYQGSVLDIIDENWDMMIGHPPCTFLSYSGLKYWDRPGRAEKREEALNFFKTLYNSNIPRIALENPMGYVSTWKHYDQLIEPYYFGDPEKKRTCLWLKNLPPLISTLYCNIKPVYIDKSGKKRYRTDAISGSSKNAQKERSKFFTGIAQAMAEQWGSV